MLASIGNTVNIWQYFFSFPYLLLRVHVCKCWYHGHSLEISISFSLSSLKDPWLLYSCRSIVIRQQVSLRKYGRIHTGPSPLCKMSAQGQPAALIQAHRHKTTRQHEDSRSHSAIYRGGQLNWWRKSEDSEKTTDLSQVTDNRDHIMLYTSPSSRFELTTSVVIGTDCICSCKSNYHTITATMAFSFSICLLLTIHYIWTFFILDISKYSGCFKCVQILYSTFCVQTISMIHFYTIVLTGFTRWLRGHCGRDCMVFVFTTTYAVSAYHN